MKEKQPSIQINPDEYYIKVWRGAKGVSVDFTRIVRYVPLHSVQSEFEYDVIVNLVNKLILPFDKSFPNKPFYVPSEQDAKALAFIKAHFGGFTSQFENTICEEEDEYKISCTNEVAFGYYTINKKTGEQGNSIQGSYQPKPFENGKTFVDEIF